MATAPAAPVPALPTNAHDPRPCRRRGCACPQRRRARGGGGVTLLFALTTIVLLTTIATEFMLSTRVGLEAAVTSRDALRARSLATSAVNYARLMLHFQKKLDAASGAMGGGLSSLLGTMGQGADLSPLLAMASGAGVDPSMVQSLMQGGLGGLMGGGLAGAAGAAGAQPRGPSVRLWEAVPLDSNALMGFVASAFPLGDTEAGLALERKYEDLKSRTLDPEEGVPNLANFGEFTGDFGAKVTDEDQKVNLHRLSYALNAGQLATYVDLTALMQDKKYDFLFRGEDADGNPRIRREELVLALKDFADVDETSTTLDLSQPLSPFAQGFGDENGPYARLKRRYQAKNAPFDSVGELLMVDGIGDAFMAAFGDRFTIYPSPRDKINVNTTDPRQMLVNMVLAAENKADPLLFDPLRLQLVMQQIQMLKVIPFIGLSLQQFTGVLQANGIRIDPAIQQNSAQNAALGDLSQTFRIVATGTAGRVTKTLTAVVRYNDGMGQVLYWNER